MSKPSTPSEKSNKSILKTRVNWSLITGSVLVIIIIILAIYGPIIAPNDPREHKLIIRIDGNWLTPPYPAFTPGYPLGSDNLGRDLYSWLLWSIRPTMILVIIVAGTRMLLGVLIGVIAGWSDRTVGRIFDWLIAGALAVPTLIAALIIITAVGFKLGVWAFVVGMSVTGWAETAQLVRERTRTIKGQESIEAAIALGASNSQTFFLHILPQVMPMIWMLLAFEVANSLVTSAGLGFLGYYLGGAVFTEVDDFVYQRISEMPELGQMLATAWMVLDEPWAMVAAGSVVFAIVLAFNLVGDGLQARLTRKLGGVRSLYSFIAGEVIPWLNRYISEPVQNIIHRRAFRYAAGVILVVAVVTSTFWMLDQRVSGTAGTPQQTIAENPDATATKDVLTDTSATSEGTPGTGAGSSESGGETPTSPLQVAGDHIWASEGHDPWFTRWVDFSGPLTTTIQWTLEREGGFVGGPAINATGILYIAAREVTDDGVESGNLIALDSEGTVIWETALDRKPVGSPTLAADGTIYVADKQGLNAFSPAGTLLWQYTSPEGDPTADGPIIDADGSLYLKSYGAMSALAPDGNLRWRTAISESAASMPPHLSVDEQAVFWRNLGFKTEDGSPYDWSMLTPLVFPPAQVVIGADGQTYLRYAERLIRSSKDETALREGLVFDGSAITWGGVDAGVTPGGRTWLSARPSTSQWGLGLYWATPEGNLSSKTAIIGQDNVQIIGVDVNDITYSCMDSYDSGSSCVAASPMKNGLVWKLLLPRIKVIAGAALAPERLYVATRDGTLFAVGSAVSSAEGTPEVIPALVDPGPAWSQPEVPGNHIWPMAGHDAWGTLWTEKSGPQTADIQWIFDTPLGFNGPPVIAADGTLYACTKGAELLALSPAGEVLWRIPTPYALIGAPALGADGTIYVTDAGGYLNAYNPNGNQLWRYHPTGIVNNPTYSNSGRIIREDPIPIDALGPAGAGPIVAPDGTIYYSLGLETREFNRDIYFRTEVMVVVSPDGHGLIDPPRFIGSNRLPARLYPSGEYIFWGDMGLYPLYGVREEDTFDPYNDYVWNFFEEQGNAQLYTGVGADGRAYFACKRTIVTWFLTDAGIGEVQRFNWETETSPGTARSVGATPNGLRWLFFSGGKFIWIAEDDRVIGPVKFPFESMVIAVDSEDTVYGCGSSMGKAPECMAYRPDSLDARWHVTLGEGETVVGGSLAPGTLYVATKSGRIYALGD